MKDPVEAFEKEILNEYNTNRLETLVIYAKYFANCKTASLAKLDGVDSFGFTVSYMEQAEEGLCLKEVRIAFSSPVKSRNELEKMLNTYAHEAKTVLSMNPDKNYIPPGRIDRNKIDFFWPSTLEFSLTILWWAMLYSFVFSKDLPAIFEAFRRGIGGEIAAFNMVASMLAVNLALCVAAFGFCIWAGFPLFYTIFYPPLTIFGGFSVVGPVIKLAMKYKEREEENSIIGKRE